MSESLVIPLETKLADFHANVVDVADFNERVVGAYNNGTAEKGLEADNMLARSVIPAGTGALRDFSYIAPDIPVFLSDNCVGCMDCVTECPDTAILGKVIEPSLLDQSLAAIGDERNARAWPRNGPSLTSTTPSSRRKAPGEGSSASSSTPPSAKAALSAWTPAATTTPLK